MMWTSTGTRAGSDPVLTFYVGDQVLALSVAQVDRICEAKRLWSIPFASKHHAGLHHEGEKLVPVLRFKGWSPQSDPSYLVLMRDPGSDQIFGLAMDRSGRVYHDYTAARTADASQPEILESTADECIETQDGPVWRLDPHKLWQKFAE